jgi:hypothetical protein
MCALQLQNQCHLSESGVESFSSLRVLLSMPMAGSAELAIIMIFIQPRHPTPAHIHPPPVHRLLPHPPAPSRPVLLVVLPMPWHHNLAT